MHACSATKIKTFPQVQTNEWNMKNRVHFQMLMGIPAFYFYQIAYKKGLTEQQTQFTSLPDPPDVEFAKKVTNQVSKVRT